MRHSPANPLIEALFHLACCGAPLLVFAVAVGVFALSGVIALGAAIAAGVVAILAAFRWRRRRVCQTPNHMHQGGR